MSRFVPSLSLGGQTTRPAGTGSDTGQRGASVSDREVFFPLPINPFAGALGLNFLPCSSTASIALRHPPQFAVQPCTPAGEPAPIASLAEEDDNKVCLPAKRQRSSTLGIGTVYTPFGSLQVKVLASFAAARLTSTGNARRVCGVIGKHGNGVTKADFQNYGCHESEL